MKRKSMALILGIVGIMAFSGCNKTEEMEVENEISSVKEEIEVVEMEEEIMETEEVIMEMEENTETEEVVWQMTEEDRMAFETLMTGIYWGNITEGRLEEEGEIKPNLMGEYEKYSFMISFLQGENDDNDYLPFNISDKVFIASKEDVEYILQSALGSGFISDFESAMQVGSGYVTEIETDLYRIYQGDGDTYCDIDIISGEQLDEERIRITGKVNTYGSLPQCFEKYDISAILEKNESSVFGGYTLKSTQYVKQNLTWQEAYAIALLLGYTESDEYIDAKFWGLHDFDNNGIPELLLASPSSDDGTCQASDMSDRGVLKFEVYSYTDDGMQKVWIESGPYDIYYDTQNNYVLTCNQEVRATPVTLWKYDISGFKLMASASQEEDECTQVYRYYPEKTQEVMESPDIDPFEALSNSYTTFTYYDVTQEAISQGMGIDIQWFEPFY